jgi:hypothetical protein
MASFAQPVVCGSLALHPFQVHGAAANELCADTVTTEPAVNATSAPIRITRFKKLFI